MTNSYRFSYAHLIDSSGWTFRWEGRRLEAAEPALRDLLGDASRNEPGVLLGRKYLHNLGKWAFYFKPAGPEPVQGIIVSLDVDDSAMPDEVLESAGINVRSSGENEIVQALNELRESKSTATDWEIRGTFAAAVQSTRAPSPVDFALRMLESRITQLEATRAEQAGHPGELKHRIETQENEVRQLADAHKQQLLANKKQIEWNQQFEKSSVTTPLSPLSTRPLQSQVYAAIGIACVGLVISVVAWSLTGNRVSRNELSDLSTNLRNAATKDEIRPVNERVAGLQTKADEFAAELKSLSEKSAADSKSLGNKLAALQTAVDKSASDAKSLSDKLAALQTAMDKSASDAKILNEKLAVLQTAVEKSVSDAKSLTDKFVVLQTAVDKSAVDSKSLSDKAKQIELSVSKLWDVMPKLYRNVLYIKTHYWVQVHGGDPGLGQQVPEPPATNPSMPQGGNP